MSLPGPSIPSSAGLKYSRAQAGCDNENVHCNAMKQASLVGEILFFFSSDHSVILSESEYLMSDYCVWCSAPAAPKSLIIFQRILPLAFAGRLKVALDMGATYVASVTVLAPTLTSLKFM